MRAVLVLALMATAVMGATVPIIIDTAGCSFTDAFFIDPYVSEAMSCSDYSNSIPPVMVNDGDTIDLTVVSGLDICISSSPTDHTATYPGTSCQPAGTNNYQFPVSDAFGLFYFITIDDAQHLSAGLNGWSSSLDLTPYSSTGEDPYSSTGDAPYSSTGDAPYSSTGDAPYSSTGDAPYSSTGDAPYSSTGDAPYSSTGDAPYSSTGVAPYSSTGVDSSTAPAAPVVSSTAAAPADVSSTADVPADVSSTADVPAVVESSSADDSTGAGGGGSGGVTADASSADIMPDTNVTASTGSAPPVISDSSTGIVVGAAPVVSASAVVTFAVLMASSLAVLIAAF